MLNDETVSRAFRDLKEKIRKEQEVHRLRELVIEINLVLDLIERQVAKLEGNHPPPAN